MAGGNSVAHSTQVAGKGSLTFKPVKGLSISGIVSPFINYQKKKAFKNSCGYTLADDPETFGGYFDSGSTWTTNSLTETVRMIIMSLVRLLLITWERSAVMISL